MKGWIVRRYNWMDANLSANYSDVEWKSVDFLQIGIKPSVTTKLPISLFADSAKNITAYEFISKTSNMQFQAAGDSVAITVNNPGDYSFKVLAKNNNQTVCMSPEYKINVPTSINSEPEIIYDFELSQNYPNPFNPSTTIMFSIPSNVKGERSNVVLDVYDILGNEVAALVNEEKQPGHHSVEFNAIGLPSGVYFYQLKVGSFIATKKMILLQ
jgi:hypothetical protein